MILLAFGVLATSLMQLVAAVPPLKARLKAQLGEKAYRPVFGIASLVGIAIIVLGWRSANFVPVYDPPEWGWIANGVLTLLAFICLGIFIFRGSLRQKLRFPMAIAVVLWAAGHLLANGDLAGIILFGGFAAYGLAHIAIGTANGVRPPPEMRQGHDLLSVLIGIALYGILVQLHGALFGVHVFELPLPT